MNMLPQEHIKKKEKVIELLEQGEVWNSVIANKVGLHRGTVARYRKEWKNTKTKNG